MRETELGIDEVKDRRRNQWRIKVDVEGRTEREGQLVAFYDG